MKKWIPSLSGVLSCVVAGLIVSLSVPVSSEYRFREFNSDREKFERYSDQAEKSATEQQWQDILDSGRQEMVTDWERTAEHELERYVREGAVESEVRVSFEEALAEWESEFDRAEARAKGSWYVSREQLVFERIDFSGLKQSVNAAGDDKNIADIAAWDSYVSSALAESEKAWEDNYLLPLDGLKVFGGTLSGEVKSGFDEELARLERSLREKFDVEKNLILYGARNSFINELYVDTESLRYISSQKSAETATDNVIKEVQDDLKSEEEKILSRDYSAGGGGVIDFSAMGENWQDELKQLVKSGIERWNVALEKLYSQMVNWKTGAENAFYSAEALWRKSAEKLEAARLEWEKKLSAEINESLVLWIGQQDDLRENIEKAQTDLNEYMANLSTQWNDHSSGLVNMAINGAQVYNDAVGNIKWLEEMCADSGNGNIGAFGAKDTPVNITDNFMTILTAEEKAAMENSVSDKRSEFGYGSLAERYLEPACADEYCITKKDVPINFYEGSYSIYFTIDGEIKNIPAEAEGMAVHFGKNYYDSVYYKTVFTGAAERQDGSGNWYIEENYSVKVYLKKMVYGQKFSDEYGIYTVSYGWYENEVFVTSFDITNSVTKGSADYEKSSYYYYKTELERWKNIKEQFANIASDAEYYMHGYNMLGQNEGPGYLDKDEDSDSDPYLMTDAEFQLELAERDKGFWQQRLDIAKVVLDYAEEAKRESADETERKKAEAYTAMDDAKGVYEDNLSSVNKIIEELKKIQGDKPPDALNDENREKWEAYNTSIEYLSKQYREANKNLQTAETVFSSIKQSIIFLQNSETDEFLKKQISEIEKNIVETEREIYLKRTELFSAQMQREYSERTARYANSYKDSVTEYEGANRLFTALKQIVTGEENDTTLYAWGNAIISSDVLKDVEYDTGLVDGIKKYSVMLAPLVSDPAKKSELSSFIRSIYFTLQNRVSSAELVVKTLQNMNFDAVSFLKQTYTADHAVYKEYADISIEALDLINDAFESVGSQSSKQNYDYIIGQLYGGFSALKYNYGGDNRDYIAHYAACMYFADNFKGLSSGNWNSALKRVQTDIDYNEEAADVHDDLVSMDSEELKDEVAAQQTKASNGDMEAVAWLREYYKTGSGIAAIEYIKAFDKRSETDFGSYMALQLYVYENQGYFSADQRYMTEHQWLADIVGYINIFVPSISWSAEFTFDGLKGLDAAGMSLALTAFEEYIESLEDTGRAVPEFIISAANELMSLKALLNEQLFIQRYMSNDSSDEMKGTADEIYDRKSAAALMNERVLGFIEGARDAIDAGAGDDYKIAMSVLSLYEKISIDEKNYISENSNEKIKSVHSFVTELYSRRDRVELAKIASDYNQMAASVTPEDYASMKGVTGEKRDNLIAAVTPAYDIKVFIRDYGDGKVADIEQYVSGLGISSERKINLLNYALVSEYVNRVKDGVTSTDPAFADYKSSKKFEDLPEEVRIYLASQYCYEDSFLNNRIIKGDLEDYLEAKFGEAGITGSVVDAVERYTGRLNAVSLSYTGDINSYADTLSPDASKYFLMYVNGEADAVLPGFEYGIYGGCALNASVNVEVGRITSALDGYCQNYNDTFNAQYKNFNAAKAGLDCAAALKDFLAGVDGMSWRDGIFAVTEEVPAEVQDEEKEGTEYTEKNLILLSIFEETGVWADTLDEVTGIKSLLVQSNTKLERGGRIFSKSGIIDSMNSILSVFESLNQSLKNNYKTEGATGIAEFMQAVPGVYTLGSIYDVTAEGVFTFEAGFEKLVTDSEMESSVFKSAETDIKSSFDGLYAGTSGMKSSIVAKKSSYDLLAAEGGIEELKIKLEAARVEHEAAKGEYRKKEDDLKEAQNRYANTNKEYAAAMDGVSSSYKSYQDAEFAYEKAYAKWEYANTPYLMDTVTDAAQINTGGNVSGDVVSYENIPVPDAKENYKNIKEKFDKAEKTYNEALAAVNSQDTVAKINSDVKYSKDKTGFVQSTESYIRLSQVLAEVTEDLEVYERDEDLAEKGYISAKNAVSFYSSKINQKDPALSEDEKKALLELRDRILAHILVNNSDGTNEIGKYIDAITWYTCAKTVDNYNTLIAEAERNKALVQQEIAGYQANIAELRGQIAELAKNSLFGSNDEEIKELETEISSLNQKIEGCKFNISIYDAKIAEYNDSKGVFIPDSDKFKALSAGVRGDIEAIFTQYMTADCLQKILDNYPLYVYHKREWEHACYRVSSTHNPVTKRRWKNKRDTRWGKMKAAESVYTEPLNAIKKSLDDALTAKTDYQKKASALNGMVSVRYIDDIKTYLKQSKYSLNDYDLNIYDSSDLSKRINDLSLNITGLREEKQRTDIDGAAVKAVVKTVWDETAKANIRVISVLGKDGSETGERYNIDDKSVVLKSGGTTAENYADGVEYDFYDNNYNIKSVAGFLQLQAKEQRQEYLANLKGYMYKTKENGGFDKKVVLQDLEQTYSELQDYAAEFNLDNESVEIEEKEYRQRSFEGYITITKEYVNNGAGESIQGLIINELMKQNMQLQNQLWQHQIEKLQEKKERWSEVVGYIMNRGYREWRENLSEFKTKWNNWRNDARKMISDGEEWWKKAGTALTLDMNTWIQETTKASSKEAAGRVYNDLEARINRYETDIKKRMPGSVNFDLSTDKILADAMKNTPVDSIGVLKTSMNAVDTTAGFTDMLNLGLSGTLTQKNEAQMKEYTDAMSVMSNLRVIDILNGIIEGFNKQLGEANKKVYDGLGKFATSTELSVAPFERKEDENKWSIRVCVESNLIGGDKYKVRLFEDYKYYVNQTVFIKPLNGLNGKNIDFNDANTYINLDADELDTYVGLEAEWLNREIEKVFKNGDENGKGGGLFSSHINSEQERLKDEFIKYYTEWKTGEMMRNAMAYNKPIAHGAPSITVSISIGAQIIGTAVGGPAGAAVGQFAASVLTTGLDLAFGEISLQQAGAQFGTGLLSSGAGIFAPVVNGALSGIEYDEDGGVSWNYDDCKDGMRSGIKEMGVRALTGNIPGLSDMAASWVETDGGWADWGFDNEHWGDHIIAGIGGLLSATKLPGQSGQFATELLRFMAYNIGDGRGFEDREGIDEGMFNWNQFRGNAATIGSLLPQMISLATGGDHGHDPNSDKNSDPLQQAEELLNGLWVGIRQGYEEGGVTGAFASLPGAYSDFVFNSIAQEYDDTRKSWFAMNVLGGFSAIDSLAGGLKKGWDWLTDTIGGFFGWKDSNDFQNDLGVNNINKEIDNLKGDDSVKSQELMEKLDRYRDLIAQKNEDNKINADENAKSGKWYTVFSSTEEAIDYIQTKKELGLPLNSDDARMLAQTMWQNSNGQLANEFADFIRKNSDKFASFDIDGLDVDNEDSIKNFANKVANGSCFINTIFMNIILSSKTDGVPMSWGEMYVKAMDGGLLQDDGIKTTQYMNKQEGIQKWVDTLIGKDELTVTGYFQGDGMSSADIFNNIPGLANFDVLVSGGRFDNNHHSMMQFVNQGSWSIFDTGRPNRNGPRPYGIKYTDWYRPYNTNSFWILK